MIRKVGTGARPYRRRTIALMARTYGVLPAPWVLARGFGCCQRQVRRDIAAVACATGRRIAWRLETTGPRRQEARS